MNAAFDQAWQYILIAMGIYCIVRGIMTLTTGRLPEREEVKLRDFSENGLRRYKFLSAITNIIGGVAVIVIAAAQLLNLIHTDALRLIIVAVLAIMVIVFIAVKKSCRNMK